MDPAQAPPPKKKSSGCLIALAVVGGLAVLCMVLVGIGIWRFSQTKEGKAVFAVAGEAVKLAAEAQNAPGAKEVKAVGCDQAMVMDVERMAKLFEALDAGAPTGEFSTMVLCQVGAFVDDAPSCDKVASTYHAAVGDKERPFVVQVQHSGGRGKPICSNLYDAKGKMIQELNHGGSSKGKDEH